MDTRSAASGARVVSERCDVIHHVATPAQILRDAADALAVPAGYAETIERVTQLAIPRIALLCLIDMDESSLLTRRAAVCDPILGAGPLRLEAPHPDVGEGAAAVLRSGRALVYGRSWFTALGKVDAALAGLAGSTLNVVAVLPLIFDHRPIGVLTLGQVEPLEAFDLVFAEDFARLAAIAISNARLLEEAHRARDFAESARARLSFVARAGGVLARSFDRDVTISRLLGTTLVDFADGAHASIVELDGTVTPLRVGGGDPAALDEFALRAMRDARTRLDPVTHMLAVPLLTGGRVAGALGFSRTAARPPFAIDDLTMIEEVAARTAMFIEAARAYSHQRNVAETLQRAFRPHALPAIAGITIEAAYAPGTADIDVGGDWYDVVVLDAARVAIAIGDVMGHGVDAAAAMAEVRSGLRAHVYANVAPGRSLGYIDTLLANTGGNRDMSATAVTALYDLTARTLTIANAGHPSPYLKRASGELVQLVAAEPLLGLDAGERSETTHRVTSGDIVLFFTDGVVEDRTRSYDAGIAAVEDVLRTTAEPAEMIARIMALTVGSVDDRTLLAFRVS